MGIVNVWLMVLSPLVGEVEPACPEWLPLCAVLLIEVACPPVVQPLNVPVSKPPLVMPPPPPPLEVTVTLTEVVCVALPSVPVTVTVYAPAATVEPTLTVSVEEPPAVTEVGLSEAVGPDGETLAERLTVPAEPLVTAVLIVDLPLLP